jgi:uncharacterized membrane protein
MRSRHRKLPDWMRAASVAACFALVAVLLIALPALARQIVLKNFDEAIEVNTDGTFDVTETIEAQFIGSWHGIYRTIPTEYVTNEGLNYTLAIDDIRATDTDGHKLKVEQSTEGRNKKLKIWVPDAEDATHTIVIHYRVLDGIRFFADHDELYWNVTGNEWDSVIQKATARIGFPSGGSGLKATAYTGQLGATGHDAPVEVSGDVVTVSTEHPLGYREGLTIAVGFDKGLVHEPTAAEKIWRTLMSNKPFAIPVVALIFMLWTWWVRGRDADGGAVTVQYEPPDQLTPGECGTLIDNSVDMRDVTATLVDLAVRGFLSIEQTDESHLLGLSHSKQYTFHLKKPVTEWTPIRPHEYQLLSALFDGGATTDMKMTDLQNRFYKSMPGIKDSIFDGLMKDKYYRTRPDTLSSGYMGAGFLIGLIFVFGSGVLQSMTGISRFTWVITGILTGAVICVIGYFMSARTPAGAQARAKVLGFEDFLTRVEKDRIERLELTPQLFEKFLPFAMALGVEKKWAAAFASIAMSAPVWYSGPYGSGFNAVYFANDMHFMSAQTGMAMASSPRSSGSSGFGGGGFSGGGFGGGGGGGF